MALAALVMMIGMIVAMTMQPPMCVMGCIAIFFVLCLFCGD